MLSAINEHNSVMEPHISVIICTHNRASLLSDSIQSFFAMDLEGIDYELLIIDNASTDQTRRINQEWVLPQNTMRYIYEPQPGLSHARNTGIKQAKGEIIAFVDDDIYFDTQWLKGIVKVFESHPEIACVGGKSIPKFEGKKPEWITDQLLTIYGSTNSGDKEKLMNFPEHPFGLNMAFRNDVFGLVGFFNPKLGRKKTSLLSCEEVDLFYRINQAGLKTWYTPHAIIWHRIPSERTEKNWILQRYFWQGRSEAAFQQIVNRKSRLTLLKELYIDLNHLLMLLKELYIDFNKLKKTTIWSFLRSPRKIYWDLNAISFDKWIKIYASAGIVRQKLYEVLYLPKLWEPRQTNKRFKSAFGKGKG